MNADPGAACGLWAGKRSEESRRHPLRAGELDLKQVAWVGYQIQGCERDADGRAGNLVPILLI
ncbi:MAG: hypothetical protein ACR2QJ_07825 [Geminicoccaceae bacterium]